MMKAGGSVSEALRFAEVHAGFHLHPAAVLVGTEVPHSEVDAASSGAGVNMRPGCQCINLLMHNMVGSAGCTGFFAGHWRLTYACSGIWRRRASMQVSVQCT
jgi:hypothetical protein